MPIAITDDHRALADTAADFLAKRKAIGAARDLLEAPEEGLPAFWSDLAGLGWLGLHLPEEHGGSGYTLEELVVVVEELGRAVAPGPFVPTAIAGAVLAAAGDDELKKRLLPGLGDGSVTAGVGLAGAVTVSGGTASGDAGTVLGGGLARVLLVPAGDDVAVVEVGDGVTVDTPANLDPTRRSSRVTLDGAAVTLLPGARPLLLDLARVLLSAEAVGVARACTEMGAAYAKERIQFGRPIGTFQAVKHLLADAAVDLEVARAAVHAAAVARDEGAEGHRIETARIVASRAAHRATEACIQVHGGMGYTWELDAHLFLKRALVLDQGPGTVGDAVDAVAATL